MSNKNSKEQRNAELNEGVNLPHQRTLEFCVKYASILSIRGNSSSMLPRSGSLHATHSPVSRKLPIKTDKFRNE